MPTGEFDNSTDNGREPVERLDLAPNEAETIDPPAGAADLTGQRIEAFISPRTFVSQEWALANIASQPKGFHVTIGFIAGVVTGFERRDSNLPLRPGDAIPPPSVWLKGQFEATVVETGEIKTARWLILPRSAGELVEEALQNGAERAVLDLEIGIIATGRSIPYGYTVDVFGARRDEAMQREIERVTQRRIARDKARGRLLIEGKVNPAA